jgi:hypothetical protein
MTANGSTQCWPLDEIDANELVEAAVQTIRLVDQFTESIIRFLDQQRPADRISAA